MEWKRLQILSMLLKTGIDEPTARRVLRNVRSYGSNIIRKLEWQIESNPEPSSTLAEQMASIQLECNQLLIASRMSVDFSNFLNVLESAIRFTDHEIAEKQREIVMAQKDVNGRWADIKNECLRGRDFDDLNHAKTDLARAEEDLVQAKLAREVLEAVFEKLYR